MSLQGITIDIVGSASGSADLPLLKNAHQLVAALVIETLSSGGRLVVLAGNEPRILPDDPFSAQVFTWTILETTRGFFVDHPEIDRVGRIRAIASNSDKARIPENRRDLWNDLLGQKIVSPHHVAEASYLGALIRRKEVELSDAMIAIGGGKGVLDSANAHLERGHPVLAINIAIGASCEDAEGSPALFRKALVTPETYLGELRDEERADLASFIFEASTNSTLFATRMLAILAAATRRRATTMTAPKPVRPKWPVSQTAALLIVVVLFAIAGLLSARNTQDAERRRDVISERFCTTCEDARRDPMQCICSPKDRAYRDKICTSQMILSRSISECIGGKTRAATSSPTPQASLEMVSCFERVVSSDPANRDLLKETSFDQNEQDRWLDRCYPRTTPR
jgi:hypothetical protein